MLNWRKKFALWYNGLLNDKSINQSMIHETRKFSSNTKWYWPIITIFNYIGLFFISVCLLLVKIFLMIYQAIKSFFYLIFCTFRQCCTKKPKKIVRNNSGFLDSNSNNHKITLVLDLDSTLIYSSTNKIENAKNYAIIENKFYVYKRPHLDSFLSSLSQFCDMVIYTASTKEYADKVIDYVDKNRLISQRYYRQDCLNIDSYWYKDVSKYGFDERKLIIIDDIPNCHLSYRRNIIHIRNWNGQDERDDSLMKIKNIIKNFFNCGRFEVSEVINSTINNDV
jgi:Dullard-like phosphatase family protein